MPRDEIDAAKAREVAARRWAATTGHDPNASMSHLRRAIENDRPGGWPQFMRDVADGVTA